MLIVTGVNDGGAPTGYKSVGDGIVYDEAWDETAELLNSDEGKKESEVETSGIARGEKKHSELGESDVGGEVENFKMKNSEMG